MQTVSVVSEAREGKRSMKKAKVILDADFTVAETDKKLFSSFVEPLGRCVYGGLYEPGHPTADEDGFRRDVMDVLRPLNLTMNRFPGGNFVSTYRWEDGIGPKDKRPVRPEPAWQCTETNRFGLDEFARWSRKMGSDVMMTVNLTTRGVLEAMDCVEYCNLPGGTFWSEKRKENGFKDPLGYRYWCLSNEVDGVWQVGQKPAREYGLLAREASKGMKRIDPGIRTVLAGSSAPDLDTCPDYDAEVLDIAYDQVDYISIHNYIGNSSGDSLSYAAKPLIANRFIEDIAAVIRMIRLKHRTDHRVYISFDEFNTWHSINTAFNDGRLWRTAPPLLEDTYTAEDVIALGGMLLAVLRHADVVKIACLSEIVNCISHVRTRNGGGCWVMPPYYAYLHYSRYGRGTVLQTNVRSDTYSCEKFGEVPLLDAQAVRAEDGSVTVFAINRSFDEELELEVLLRGFGDLKVEEHLVVTSDDPAATNTEECPDNVVPTGDGGAYAEDGAVKAVLKKMSWNVIRLAGSEIH